MVFYIRNGSKRLFCVRNGSVTPREVGFAKQTQVMLLEGWSVDDVASRLIEISSRFRLLPPGRAPVLV
jgi:hypothetical protein